MTSPWLVHRPRATAPSWRLLCLPHAGAGVAALAPWFTAAPDDCEVVVARLPGRESRFREPALHSITDIAGAVRTAWQPLLDRPFAVFGYSMGGLIAYELTTAFAESGASPVLLAVGGMAAPHRPSDRRPIHDLPDAEFAAALRALGGTPDEVLDHPDLFALLAPVLRADLAAVETYRHEPRAPLTVPAATYTGVDDTDVDLDDVMAWDEVTSAGCAHRRFAGGHFFFGDRPATLLDAVVADYRAVAAGSSW